jgi:hypothetical protein
VLVMLSTMGCVIGHYLIKGLLGLDLIQLEDDPTATIETDFGDVLISAIGKNTQLAPALKGLRDDAANEIVLFYNSTHIAISFLDVCDQESDVKPLIWSPGWSARRVHPTPSR